MVAQEASDAPDAVEAPDASRGGCARALPVFAVAAGIYLLTTLVFLAVAGPERFGAHTPYNHFALLARAWLDGRLDLGGPPPAYTGFNDFALHDGKYFVSFPPFPALLLLPYVALAGRPELVRDGLFFGLLSGLSPALLYVALERLRSLGRSRLGRREAVGLSLLFAFGTVYFFSAVQGTVWFAAHVVGTALGCLYLALALGASRPLLAGLALGCAFATRTPLAFAAPLFVYEACRASRASAARLGPLALSFDPRALLARLVPFGLGAGAVLALVLWHNEARFGDPFEFGHRLLAVAWRPRMEKYGLFSVHYLGRNLGIALASLPFFHQPGPAPFRVNAHGLALWLTSPFYVWALFPRRATPTFKALALTAAGVALPSLLYQNSGWVQFGYRFSNDFAPFLFAMIAVSVRRLSLPFALAGAFAIAVNAFGAITFDRAGFEHYYFFDRTQRIVFEPD